MRKTLLTFVFIAFLSPLCAQSISVYFLSPSNYKLVTDSTVSIQLHVTSTNALKNVIVVSGPNSDTLTYSSTGTYTGTLSLSGLAQDTLTIKGIVTDLLNNTDSAIEYIIYDPIPVLTIVKPLNFSVANPTIEVKASCKGSAHGCSITINNSSAYPDSADITVDLSTSEGMEYYIPVTAAENKYHQSTTQKIHVYVESSPYLKPLFVCQDKIWDFNSNHILTAVTHIPYPTSTVQNTLTGLKLVNITDSSVSSIPYYGNIAFIQGESDWLSENLRANAYVTPQGAVFSGIPTDPSQSPYNNDSVYDWNQSSLTVASSSQLNGAGSLDVSDDRGYSVWSEGLSSTNIVYRNQASKTNTTISTPSFLSYLGNYDNDIAPNGTVAFWGGRPGGSSGYINDVMTYKNGTIAFVSDSNENKWAMRPVTDGKRVVYEKIFKTNPDSFQIVLYDGSSNIILSHLGNNNPGVYTRQYQINPGYVAYVQLGTSGQFEIWLRDSTGTSTRLSYFFNSSTLEKLASNGDVVYYCGNTNSLAPGNRRYLSDKTGTVKEIGSGNFGKVMYTNGQWYVAIGRTLYGIDLTPQPDQITSFTRNPVQDSAYQFTLADFAGQFAGGGNLMGIKITGLPGKGQLLQNGHPVALNSVLTRTQIGSLKYVISGGLMGVDSIRWDATNGINFTGKNAYALLTALVAPHMPNIIPLTGSYCAGSGIKKVKITNLPDTTKGYTVTIRSDAGPLSIAPDSTFSINTGALSPGLHKVEVVFTNAVGSDSASASFTIVAIDTPRVGLTASSTTVRDSVSAGVVTATAISGGGTNPQFTFSSDRGFVNILQSQSSSDQLPLSPSSLKIGSNWIYVLMQTSDTCYTSPTATDSIQITRIAAEDSIPGASTRAKSLADPDYPNQPITIYPNPLQYQLNVSGLQASKTYDLSLYGLDGRQVFSRKVTGRQSWQGAILLEKGVYALKLYDMTKSRVIGTINLLVE